MQNSKAISALTKIIPFFIALAAIYFYCERQIGDFETAQIISTIPNDPKWETDQVDVEALLSQTFSYLGSGGQSYAFLGEDKKTVLKLFKHYDKQGKRPLEHIFQSCQLAYEELKEETGLIYLHLNKSSPFPVTLIDKLGFSHVIDLNATEYALQKKADNLIFPTLLLLYKKGEKEEVKKHIQKLLQLIDSRSKKGIADRDTALRRNFGFLLEEAIDIDIGSFYRDESLKDPLLAYEELKLKTARLYRWLKKHAPDLATFYEEELAQYQPLTKNR